MSLTWRDVSAGVLVALVLAYSQGVDAQLAPVGGQSSVAPSSASPQGLLAPAPPPVRGRYLDAVPSVVRDTKTGRLSLALDITAKPGMRVYAPGNDGYTPIAVSIDPPAAVRAAATSYPRPEEYLFAPLNERFKVYTGSFRLARTLAPVAAAGEREPATVTGKLEYQACDDKVCYLPQTLPLSWTIVP